MLPTGSSDCAEARSRLATSHELARPYGARSKTSAPAIGASGKARPDIDGPLRLWRDWKIDKAGYAGSMPQALSRLLIVVRICVEDIRDKNLRIAVVQRKER